MTKSRRHLPSITLLSCWIDGRQANIALKVSKSDHTFYADAENDRFGKDLAQLNEVTRRACWKRFAWAARSSVGEDVLKTYLVTLECSGPLAMYARPDTGGSPTSYPAPTWSAAKGILESIAFLSRGDAWFHPTRVEICRRIGVPGGLSSFQRYAFNYGGPLRKDLNFKTGTGMQVFATAVANPCYRIHAEIRGFGTDDGRNSRHYLHDLFERRIKQGRCHKTPALGWSEFTCDYWGPFRPEWETDDALNVEIPSMLSSVWDQARGGVYVSRFVQDVRIEKGVLRYVNCLDDED